MWFPQVGNLISCGGDGIVKRVDIGSCGCGLEPTVVNEHLIVDFVHRWRCGFELLPGVRLRLGLKIAWGS